MIRDKMCFADFCDFYIRRAIIKKEYMQLNRDDKIVYKYYVYSRRILRDTLCDAIWGYLNGIDDEELAYYTSYLSKEYSKHI